MRKFSLSLNFIILGVSLFYSVTAVSVAHEDPKQGKIYGTLPLDSIWQPVAYLSFVDNFYAMNSMSYDMIIGETTIDPNGEFCFELHYLPKEHRLYRVHMVKKGDPPASIIIGGREENHFFIVANRYSEIKVASFPGNTLPDGLSFSGCNINGDFQKIKSIGNYADSAFSNSPAIKREFIKKAVYEKYRYIADTCSHPLLSLYSVYNSKFESNYHLNREFYNSYSRKWKDNNSSYFRAFREQLPTKSSNEHLIRLSIALIFVVSGFALGRVKWRAKSQTDELTVQERKIFKLIQQGVSNQEISDKCNIGLSTVKSHVRSIYSKLKINSRKEAMNIERSL